jgi:SSS family solute:Na+ symporter
MAIIFVLCIIGMVIISIRDNKRGIKPNGFEVDKSMFKVDTPFAVGALIVGAILIALYTLFW